MNLLIHVDHLAAAGRILARDLRIDALLPEACRTDLLFQDDLLVPRMCVAENLLFALPAGPTELADTQRATNRVAPEARQVPDA